MLKGINKRFQHYLLDAPVPSNKQAYSSLFNVMFPDVDDFHHFLSTQRHEEQVGSARRILLRLSVESYLPATNRLLLNLLAFESSLGGQKAKSTFIGRDHFVHLVHLYLFGLYLFWYHSPFQQRLIQHFSALDPNLNFRDVPKEEIAVRMFLAAWTSFVLLHDLSYPVESGGDDPSLFPFIKPAAKEQKNIEKEFALLCLSRLVAIRTLCIVGGPPVSFEDFYSAIFKSGALTRSIKQGDLFQKEGFAFKNWTEAIRMPTGFGISLFPVLRAAFSEQKLLGVIEHVQDHRPIWLYDYGTRSELRFSDESKGSSAQQTKLGVLIDRAKSPKFSGSETGDFQLVFFVKDFEAGFSSACESCTGSAEGLKNIDSLAHSYSASDPLPFSLTSPFHDFDDCTFHFYHALLRDLDYVADDDEDGGGITRLGMSYRAAKRAVTNLEGRLVRELTFFLSDQIKKSSRRLAQEGIRVNNRLPKEYISALLSPLSETAKQAEKFAAKMSQALRKQVEVDSLLRTVFRNIREQIKVGFPMDADPACGSAASVHSYIRQKLSDISTNSLLEAVAKRFEKASGLSWSDLLKYRPDYIEHDTQHTDHGIGAASYGAGLGDALSKNFEIASGSAASRIAGANLLNLAANGGSNLLRLIRIETIYAILIHNLYPEFLPEDGQHFRTRHSDNPFAYFALFCDSLQPWDRKRLVNPAYVERSYGTSSDMFDVEIRGNTLYISEAGHGLNIEDRLNALKRYLDAYLDSASSLLKIRLGEFTLE